jgi:hypothetical protein
VDTQLNLFKEKYPNVRFIEINNDNELCNFIDLIRGKNE